jgi:hypothetical protein
MSLHRFQDLLNAEDPLPAVAAPALMSSGFMACPVVLQAGVLAWQHVYQLAYEQARAVVSPSRLERWQKATPN